MNTSWRGGDSFASYVKLREGVQIGQVEAQAETFIDRHELRGMMEEWGMTWHFFPIAQSSRIDFPVEPISWVLMALAALTLFVAAMNYVLISISTLVSRSKTIAMLKVGGARRSDIFRIFCSETAVLTLASVVVAAFLLWALQDQVREITGTPMAELFALKRIWVPLIVILAAFALRDIGVSRCDGQPPPLEAGFARRRNCQLYVHPYAPAACRAAVRQTPQRRLRIRA